MRNRVGTSPLNELSEIKFIFRSMNEISQKITFRLLKKDDLELIHKWFLSDHVIKWYSKKKWTFAELKNKYLPRIFGKAPTSCFLILFKEKPIGQVQMYKISDYPEYKKIIQVDENAAGADLFIGEKDYLHKGLGSIIIKKFLRDFVFAQLEVDSCIMGPDPKNMPAIKAYQKAGFSHFKTIFNPEENEEEYLMRITKKTIGGK